MSEKSVFCEASSPEIMSQSFPVSCFWSRGFVPHRKWNFTFLVCKYTGKENCYGFLFLFFLSVHCGDFIEKVKKICHIHFKEIGFFVSLDEAGTCIASSNMQFLTIFNTYEIYFYLFYKNWKVFETEWTENWGYLWSDCK